MLSNAYEIHNMEQLHEHIQDYQDNLLDSIENLRTSRNHPEAHYVLNKLQEQVEILPYKKMSIFYGVDTEVKDC